MHRDGSVTRATHGTSHNVVNHEEILTRFPCSDFDFVFLLVTNRRFI